jgi:hypothetical protein
MPNIVVGHLTTASAIAEFFAPEVQVAFVDLLRSAGAEEAVARAWVSPEGTVRALQITFADADGASSFLDGNAVATPSASPNTPSCSTPEGRDAGCGEYENVGSSGVTHRAALNWKSHEQVTVFVAEAPSRPGVLKLVDWVADHYGAPSGQ